VKKNSKNMSDNPTQPQAELAKVVQTIINLRELLSGEALTAALAPLLTRQAELQAILTGSGALAQGAGAQAVGESGVLVDGSVGGSIVIAKEGAKVYIGEAPVAMPAVDRESALGRYLQHLISRNRYLQLQGIRSGGRLVNIELDQIYVTLRATRQRIQEADWLAEEANLAPGEMRRRDERRGGEDADFISPPRAGWPYWAIQAAARRLCCATWPYSMPAIWPSEAR
jgi:hypothetical protein